MNRTIITISVLILLIAQIANANMVELNPSKIKCADIQKVLNNKHKSYVADSRELTTRERKLLKSEPNYFEDATAYSSEEEVLDIDNDGKKEIFTFQIIGPDRRGSMSVFSLPAFSKKDARLFYLFSGDAGFVEDPYFVRVKNKNYMIISDITDEYGGLGKKVVEFAKSLNSYTQIIKCEEKAEIHVVSACKAPACMGLVARIRNNVNNEFTNEIWPHKYMAAFGLRVFAQGNPVAADYDNSGTNRYIWRLGRDGYLFENIYWSWMGEGSKDKAPYVKRPKYDTEEPREIIPGFSHDNLRKTIKQHEHLLKKRRHLKPSEILPKNGAFFFHKYRGVTYWIWCTGHDATWGELMHIIYTKNGRSEYIGSVSTKYSTKLVPCRINCEKKLKAE